MKKLTVLLFAFGALAFGQDSNPQFLIGAGAGISPYSTATTFMGRTSAIGTFAVRVAPKIYSWSSLQMVPGVKSGAIMNTGAGYVAHQGGKFALIAIGQAGISVSDSVTLGTFSGGGLVTYLLDAKNQIYLTAGVTITGISGNTVQPSFGLGIAKGF